jgi:hypothetical protein
MRRPVGTRPSFLLVLVAVAYRPALATCWGRATGADACEGGVTEAGVIVAEASACIVHSRRSTTLRAGLDLSKSCPTE